MTPSIGFVLATYNQPEQTLLLCNKLTAMFDAPPIAIHHDFGQSPLDRSTFPANVAFVDSWKPTRWGNISVVEAVIAATRLLYQTSNPDWVVSLSTADYPIQSASKILSDLQTTTADVLMDFREITSARPKRDLQRSTYLGFSDPAWMPLAYKRYLSIRIVPWRIQKLITSDPDWNLFTRGAIARRLFTPFRASFRPFGGDSWFTFNRRAARAFLDDNPPLKVLRKHFAHRAVPEESFYHTLFANQPGLEIENRNYRYIDWSLNGPSPKLLGREDIPALLASSAHFARKFPYDPSLFAEIDAKVDAKLNDLVAAPSV